MKKLILLMVILIITKSLFAYERTDTTFTCDLNGDDKKETVKAIIDENEGLITIKVNDAAFTYMPSSTTDFELKVIWIKDKAYLMSTNIDFYGFESSLFSYEGRLDSIGSFWSLDRAEISNSGIIKVNNWLGFWSADFEYHLNNNKLVAKYKDVYTNFDNLKEHEIKTIEKIYLHSEKMMNAKGLYEVKPNTRIYILKADIREMCKDENSWQESCNWYFIRSKDGTEGWIMLKDFQDKVEGIPWAG